MPVFTRLSCATLTAFFIATQAQPSDLHAQVSALLTRVEDLEGQLMAQRHETQTAIQQSQDALTHASILENRVAQLERWNLSQSTHLRQTQSDDDTLVHIHRVNISLHGPGAGYSSGHRRNQDSCGDLSQRISAVNQECCDEPSEDCSQGFPSSCPSKIRGQASRQ